MKIPGTFSSDITAFIDVVRNSINYHGYWAQVELRRLVASSVAGMVQKVHQDLQSMPALDLKMTCGLDQCQLCQAEALQRLEDRNDESNRVFCKPIL